MNKKSIIFLFSTVIILAVLFAFTLNNPGTVDHEKYQTEIYSSIFSLLPPVIAIILALITKEVYSSLFVGIVSGALLYANGNMELMLNTMMFNEEGGMVYKLADSWNVGILIFRVVLGIMVALMNKVGGSAAFGIWASQHIKSRVGTQVATVLLGVMIFVDDYFNCLTVGSVMRPVTDKFQVSRAKLAYLIDSTAAPVCILAPISSWAAAVSGFVEGENGLALFIKAIPYNFYALFTVAMMVLLVVMKCDYGPMAVNENNAMAGDLLTITDDNLKEEEPDLDAKGTVLDLVLPVISLIVCCVVGMI